MKLWKKKLKKHLVINPNLPLLVNFEKLKMYKYYKVANSSTSCLVADVVSPSPYLYYLDTGT